MALASRATFAGLAAFVLLTALGGPMTEFRLLLFLHTSLILLYLVLSARGSRWKERRWGLIAVDGFPLLVLPLLFWSHRYVWFPLRFRGGERLFEAGDGFLRGRLLEEAAVLVQAEGGWGSTWLFWLIPILGFFTVGFLIWSRASRESFLAWRDGAVVSFYLACLMSFLQPFSGPVATGMPGQGSRILEILSSISAWDGRAPVSVIVVVLWASWKSSRGRSLFLSKFFLALSSVTTVVVAFSPAHYALSAFMSPAVGLAGSALANYLNRRSRPA